MRPKLLYTIRFFIIASILLAGIKGTAQIINAPEPAPLQTATGSSGDPWGQACGSNEFNMFYVRFTWNPPLVNNDNEFIFEISDGDGNFTNAIEITRFTDRNTTFDFLYRFEVPTDFAGENYSMRMRSTSPAVTGDSSIGYAMYFRSVTTSLQISENGSGDIGDGTASACDGDMVTLAVHNVDNPENLTYNWYRSSTLLTGAAFKGSSIQVSDGGLYQAEIDYGSCSSANGGTLSNTISVSGGASMGLAINPPTESALCLGQAAPPLEANVNFTTLNYTWFRDGIVVQAETLGASTYIVDTSDPNFPGAYTVQIRDDNNSICSETSDPVTITNAGDFTVARDNPATVVLLPSQTETLSVSTSNNTATFQWFRNGTSITGETNSSIEINQAGDYFAEVSISGGTCPASAVNSEVTMVVEPASFELVIDYQGDYNSCENNSILLEVTTINAIATDGSSTDVTEDLLSSFNYQWQRNGVDVAGATSSTISLTSTLENGDYGVVGSLNTFSALSNTLPVQLLVNETLTITSSSLVTCPGGGDITLSTTTDLTGETFSWLRNGVDLNVISNTIDVIQEGTYQLVLNRNGCPLLSNEINIVPLDPSLIVLDNNNNDAIILVEGGSTTITASGGDTYSWVDVNNAELSNTNTVTFTEEGEYLLTATIGECEIIRQLTVSILDSFKVPNVITFNGDGRNDQWVIPNSFSNQPDVNVIIYNQLGEDILNEFDYKNNWPESSTAFPNQNTVFFYTIRNATEVLEQGTITIIR